MEDPNRLRSQPETDVMARLRRIVLGTAMLTAWVAASAPPQGRGQPPPEPARANLLIPHEGRISALDAEQARRTLTAPREMPPDFQPWWSGYVAEPSSPPGGTEVVGTAWCAWSRAERRLDAHGPTQPGWL